MPDNADNYDFSGYSYIVDAIDTVTGKQSGYGNRINRRQRDDSRLLKKYLF